MSFWNLSNGPSKPKTMLETITDVAEDLEKQNNTLKAEVASLKAALGGDLSFAENAEIKRLTAALEDAYRRLSNAKLCINDLHEAIEDVSKEYAFPCQYYSKDGGQWRVAALIQKRNLEQVVTKFAKHGLHQVGDLAPAGDYVAGIFQTAQWRD